MRRKKNESGRLVVAVSSRCVIRLLVLIIVKGTTEDIAWARQRVLGSASGGMSVQRLFKMLLMMVIATLQSDVRSKLSRRCASSARMQRCARRSAGKMAGSLTHTTGVR